ncbi:mast cell protease 4-like [Coccinella septempunctata]|uniref:mast cell protease 4-like n=1 Tax=Coccinella septempunctata TaxID=41139 RepID=UPI001D082CFC|nr:mast cell protease 4-like [Coccinella septempunctata]
MTYYITCLIVPSLFRFQEAFEVLNHSLSEYPYMVLIGTYTDQSFQLTSACAGCILTRRFILTTAHCFRAEENWVALIGTVAHEKYAAVLEKWILHPHYIATVDATYNDIALTVTEKFIDFEKNMVKPLTIKPLNKDSLEYDLSCKMIGWKTADPETLTVDVTSSDYIDQATNLATIYSLKKTFLSPRQCSSLMNLIPDVNLMPDESFMCVRHKEDFFNDTQYGFIGSPLLCIEDEHDEEWTLMGLKLNQRNIENGMPEFFVNVHRFEEYLENRMKNPDTEPYKYFCHVGVCNAKYSVSGEYCLVGDTGGCYNEDFLYSLHFPNKLLGSGVPRVFSDLTWTVVIFYLVLLLLI